MKFIRTAGSDNVDTYGRWESECGRFSVQRFQYRKIKGTKDHKSVKPYFSVYDLQNYSRAIATNLKTWSDVVKVCESNE